MLGARKILKHLHQDLNEEVSVCYIICKDTHIMPPQSHTRYMNICLPVALKCAQELVLITFRSYSALTSRVTLSFASCKLSHTQTHTHTCTQTHRHTHSHTHTHTLSHSHTHTHTRVRAHTYTLTHTHKDWKGAALSARARGLLLFHVGDQLIIEA